MTQVPNDDALKSYMLAAFEVTKDKLLGGLTDRVRKSFWKIVEYWYKDYYFHMKWYGDEAALESRIYGMIRSGRP